LTHDGEVDYRGVDDSIKHVILKKEQLVKLVLI